MKVFKYGTERNAGETQLTSQNDFWDGVKYGPPLPISYSIFYSIFFAVDVLACQIITHTKYYAKYSYVLWFGKQEYEYHLVLVGLVYLVAAVCYRYASLHPF
jgi:hypothetical protein